VKILAGGRMSGRSTPLSSSKIDLHEAVIGKFQSLKLYSTDLYSEIPKNNRHFLFEKSEKIQK
jgi:hypothetical protein